jgi:hypothetical protein
MLSLKKCPETHNILRSDPASLDYDDWLHEGGAVMAITYLRYKAARKIEPHQLTALLRGVPLFWEMKEDFLIGNAGGGLHLQIRSPRGFNIEISDWGEEWELPVAVTSISDKKEEMTAFNLEKKIHALRQLYATIHLIKSGRAKEIPAGATAIDLEEEYLAADERLQIASIGTGSVWVTLKGLVTKSGSSLVALVSLCLPATRQEIQRQLRADARTAETAADKHEFDFQVHKAKEYIKLAREINKLSPTDRGNVEKLLSHWQSQVGSSKPTPAQLEAELGSEDDEDATLT